MGTTSTYFGGSGGSTTIDPVNPRFLKNVTFATNTQFTGLPTNRGNTPITIPCSDTTFFMIEGTSSTDMHVSFWELDANGAATQLATAIQISGCDEVAAASANGTDRMMLVGGSNYDNIYHIYYNGSSLTSSSIRNWSQTYQPLTTCTCTLDGTLIGCLSSNSGNYAQLRVAAIQPDGTVRTETLGTGFHRDNHGRMIGTEQGLMGAGRVADQSNRFGSCKISMIPDTNSNLVTIGSTTQSLTMHNEFNSSNNNAPFIVPSQGGIRVAYESNNNDYYTFSINSRDAKILNTYDGYHTSSGTGDKNHTGEFAGGNGSTICRQANGTYQIFKGPNSSVQYVLFDDTPSYRTPFADLTPQGDAQSAGSWSKVSTSLVGNFIVGTWFDENNTEVNIDTWNFKG